MQVIVTKTYECEYCGRNYSDKAVALKCENSHMAKEIIHLQLLLDKAGIKAEESEKEASISDKEETRCVK